MKIILLQDIKNLGKKYDVKTVKNGYARNFLFAKKLAEPATEKNIEELEFKNQKRTQKEEETEKRLSGFSQELSGKTFEFAVRVGKKGEVFGSVGKDEIKKAVLAEIPDSRFITPDDIHIKLERPLKTFGEHRVETSLGRGIKTEVKIVIRSQP